MPDLSAKFTEAMREIQEQLKEDEAALARLKRELQEKEAEVAKLKGEMPGLARTLDEDKHKLFEDEHGTHSMMALRQEIARRENIQRAMRQKMIEQQKAHEGSIRKLGFSPHT